MVAVRLTLKILGVGFGVILGVIVGAVAVTACSHGPARGAPRIYSCDSASCANDQVFEVFDKNGAPIFSVGEYGGAGVFGDQLSVYAKDVFHPVAQLRTDGTLMIGGQVITPRDISFVHCLERHALGGCQARHAAGGHPGGTRG